VPDLLDALLERLLALPSSTVYVLVGALAALENIFPPVPADTAVGIGAFLSHRGTVVATTVFAVTWVSNVTAASLVYLAGRTLGRQFFTGRLGRRLLNPARLERIERLYRRHGAWGIFLSRFVPGVRAVVPPFAGVARLGVVQSLVPMAVASGIWYALLTAVIAKSAGRIEDVARLVGRLNWVTVLVALAAGGAIVLAVRRRRASDPSK
jgi:membrane protein DedA with SNARE-associated domain